MTRRAKARIVNPAGLHARPCHALVTCALGFESAVRVGTGEQLVNAKSIIELMTLGAPCGTELVLEAEGPDEDAAIAALVAAIESGFGE